MGTILLVEDDANMVQLLKSVLEKDGHTIWEAYNGQEALSLMGVDSRTTFPKLPDLIILDIMLPVMDGFTFHNLLLENETTRSLPIILVTAKGQMKEVFAMSPNVKAYVEKPFDVRKFRELINSQLKK
ncbi:MAG: response regulator [Elusimicrobia bacterium]|nr:response regulator [Elusimicrobiota bacterium]